MAETPVLDLQTLVERPRIAIDGKTYEILSPEECSAVDHQRFAAWGRRMEALMAQDVLSKDEEGELSEVLESLTDRIMVGVPEAARAKLNDTQRLAVAEVFTELPLHKSLTALVGAVGANRKQRRAESKKSKKKATPTGSAPTGAKSPRGSKGSSAGRRGGGSTKRRSPSSEHT